MVRDFTVICITKKLEIKMSAFKISISDVPTSYRVEKLILHHLLLFTYHD